MAYHPDLTPYSYFPLPSQLEHPPLNVGWLSVTAPYPMDTTSESFRAKLLDLCARAEVHLTLGYHSCEFCREQDAITRVLSRDKEIWLGNGEIWTIGKFVFYVAPTLIYHYVTVHGYRPPDEYIESVLATDIDSAAYRALVEQIDSL